MNQEQEYEEAVEIVAKRLYKSRWPIQNKHFPASEGWRSCVSEAQDILSLTWPSGQRVLAVLAKDQATPVFPYSDSSTAGKQAMIKAGFRRTVEKR